VGKFIAVQGDVFMIRWLIIWVFPVIIFSADTSWQFVIDGAESLQKAQVKQLKAKIVFIEDSALQKLQKKYHLDIKVKPVSGYYLVVVDPVKSKTLQEALQVHVARHFSDTLFILDKKSQNTEKEQDKKIAKTIDGRRKKSREFLGIGIEWLVLLLLSILGLTMSLYNRYRIRQLKTKQETMNQKQDEIEQEIEGLEV